MLSVVCLHWVFILESFKMTSDNCILIRGHLIKQCIYQPCLSLGPCSLHCESCHNNTGDSHGSAFLLHTEALLWGLLHSFLLLQSMYALHPRNK